MTIQLARSTSVRLGRSIDEIQAEFDQVTRELRAATITRANREADNPELYFSPDQIQLDLVGQIHSLRLKWALLKAELASAQGTYIFIGCVAEEHTKCPVEIKTAGRRLACGCECHKPKEVRDAR